MNQFLEKLPPEDKETIRAEMNQFLEKLPPEDKETILAQFAKTTRKIIHDTSS